MIFLGLPAVGVADRPLWVSVLAGVYPMLDVVVVLVILQLAFTSAGDTWSFRALTASLVLLVVGDAGYAWIGAQGHLVGSPLLDLPFFGSYTLFAVASLHPTMTQLTSAVPRPAQAWSRRRLALLVPALCLPSVTVLLSPAQTLTARVVEAVAGLVVCLLVVRRALSAVERHVAAQQTLLYQGTHDGLTGMVNRVAATDALDRIAAGAAADGGAVWAAVLDLDHFRLVNDTWGSAVGDRLLSAMASRLAAVATHHTCPLVARQGGDEFVFAGAAPSAEDATQSALRLAAALREAANRPVLVDELEFVVSVSIGAAVGAGPTSAVGLLRNADTALGRAKFEGRDRCVLYDEAMSTVVAKRLRLGTALRRAIELEELEVFYQPIVRIDGGRVQGCEALLRWTLKGEGPVSPAEFIPVAEESGLVVELGAWVLEEAATTTMRWRRSGVVDNDFSVSVNVSARQLVEGDFVATVRDVLDRTGLPARCLVLEITESVMLTDPDTSIAMLEELRRSGVRLSLDDFGTGYSSLSHLDRLPVHTVKLDRSFVAALDAPNGNAAIVRAVQGIAEALGLSVVAEGVETPAQLSTLRALRIGLGQGWLWGRAVSASDFASRWSVSAGNTITVPAPRPPPGRRSPGRTAGAPRRPRTSGRRAGAAPSRWRPTRPSRRSQRDIRRVSSLKSQMSTPTTPPATAGCAQIARRAAPRPTSGGSRGRCRGSRRTRRAGPRSAPANGSRSTRARRAARPQVVRQRGHARPRRSRRATTNFTDPGVGQHLVQLAGGACGDAAPRVRAAGRRLARRRPSTPPASPRRRR